MIEVFTDGSASIHNGKGGCGVYITERHNTLNISESS
jgi:ribonuclease HI